MYPPSTADSCQHNGHLVQVRARSVGDAWIYTTDIQMPDGTWLPPVTDHDHTYETAESALAEGMAVGKKIAENATGG